MKGGTYTKTLAKIQVRGIFRIRDIRRNVLPNYRDLNGDGMLVAHLDELQHGGPLETNRNICYRVLLQWCEFILRVK